MSVCIYVASLMFVEIFIKYYAGIDMTPAFELYVLLALLFPISVINYFIGNTVLVVRGFVKEYTLSIIVPTTISLGILILSIKVFEFSLISACYITVLHSFMICIIRVYFCVINSVFAKDITG